MTRTTPAMCLLAVTALVTAALPSRVHAEADGQLTIKSLESTTPRVTLQMSPTSITTDRTIQWKKRGKVQGDSPTLEFTSADPQTLTVELFFDTYESGEDVHKIYVQALEDLAAVDVTKGRPPLLMYQFGSGPAFAGVISNVQTRYTLFLPDGTPVRASVSIRLGSAGKVGAHAVDGDATVQHCQTTGECPVDHICQAGICALP